MDEALAWIRANAIPLAGVEPGNGFSDLHPLGAIIGSSRIVSLGEATHGTREFFQLKHRLLEFCVCELGFTVFGIEANFAESLAVNSYVLNGAGTAAQALIGLRKWCWNTEEVLALIEWMRAWNETHERKVKFYGFDISPTTVAALGVRDYLSRVAGELAADCEVSLAALSADFTEALFGQLPVSTQVVALACIERVLAAFLHERTRWIAATSELEWHLARLHAITLEQGARIAIASASGDELSCYEIRDRAMAENVRALLEAEGPSAKAVLWSHNMHAGRSSFAFADTEISLMGRCLHERFGREQLVIGFAFNQGAFRAWTNPNGGLAEHSVQPTPAGSFEAPLAEAGLPMFAQDLRNAPSEGPIANWLSSPPRRSFGGSYSAEFEIKRGAALSAIWTRPHNMFDVVLFVNSTTPSRPNPSVVVKDPKLPAMAPEPTNIGFLDGHSTPAGWMSPGGEEPGAHTVALSKEPSPSGGRTVCIARHSAPWRWGDGVLVQKFAAGRWCGRRLRFRASIRATAEGLGSGAQLFVRAWPKVTDASYDFDRPAVLATMADRPVRSAEWGKHSVEVDVPAQADAIEIGLLVTGDGSAWFGDLELESA